MADKEIKIRAVLDSSGFDQQVKQMQDRITQITRQSGVMQTAQGQYGAGSGMSKLTQRFFGDFNKNSVQDLREQFNLNVRQMQAQSRDMKEKEREVAKLEKLESKMTEAQKERVKLVNEEIKAIKEKGRTLIEENNKISNMAKGLGVTDLAGAGFKGTGVAPQATPGFFGRMRAGASNMLAGMGGGSVLAGAGMLAGRIGSVGLAGMQVAGDYIDYQRTRDRQLARNIGQSVQSANIGFESVMQGKGFMNSFENPERQAALQMAMSEREKRMMLDPLRAGGSAITSMVGYGAAGAAAGSFIPGLGTAAGAIGGGIYGLGKSMLSGGPRSGFAQLFDRDAYMQSVNQETLGNFRSNLTALKMADPEKFAAANIFAKRSGDLQNMQRQLGMSDRELLGEGVVDENVDYTQFMNREYGAKPFGTAVAEEEAARKAQNANRQEGFLTRSMRDRSGEFSFSEDRIRNNINSIFQAGGTSDFVTSQMGATVAAEYQRGGMANAARQMGAISGLGNMEGQTEEQYKKFISDAMRIGLDSSELSKDTAVANQEVRRAMEAITQVYTRSGGAEGAADLFSQGLMGGAGAEVQAAQKAFQVRNQEAGQGEGYRGALKYAFLNSEKGQEMFGGLPSYLTNAFVSYNAENLDVDDPLIRDAATRMDIKPEDMVGRVRDLQRSGENFGAVSDQARDEVQQRYTQFLKLNNLKDNASTRKQFMDNPILNQTVSKAFGTAGQERMSGFSQMSAQEKQSYVFGGMQIPKNLQADTPVLDTRKRGAFDEEEGSRASDQATALQVLTRQLPDLVKAAQDNKSENMQTKVNTFNMSQALNELVQFMKDGGEDPGGKVLNQLQDMLNRQGGQNQPNMTNRKSK